MSRGLGDVYKRQIVNSEGKYLDANAEWVDDADNAAQWTWIDNNSSWIPSHKGYYLKSGDAWLYYSNGQWSAETANSKCSYFDGLTNGELVSKDGYVLGRPLRLEKTPSTSAPSPLPAATSERRMFRLMEHGITSSSMTTCLLIRSRRIRSPLST